MFVSAWFHTIGYNVFQEFGVTSSLPESNDEKSSTSPSKRAKPKRPITMATPTKVQSGVAWDRLSSKDRFGFGTGGIYTAPTTPLSPSPRGNNIPSELTTAKVNWGTVKTPGKTPSKIPVSKSLTPTFKSTIDRFAIPDGIFADSLVGGPGVGDYNPKLPATGDELPGPVLKAPKYPAGERLCGPGTIYAAAAFTNAPAPGAYDPTPLSRGTLSASGESASFRANTPRFACGGIYKEAIGEPQFPPLQSPEPEDGMRLDTTTAAFKGPAFKDGAGDRFDDGHGIYQAAAAQTPGVGAYEAAAAFDKMQPFGGSFSDGAASIFRSTTDRFIGRGGVHEGTLAAVPGVGCYETELAAKVRGAVKLQAAQRRRQSRGIFSQLRKERASTSGPMDCQPGQTPRQLTASKLKIATVSAKTSAVGSAVGSAKESAPAPSLPCAPPPPPRVCHSSAVVSAVVSPKVAPKAPKVASKAVGLADAAPVPASAPATKLPRESDGGFKFRRSGSTPSKPVLAPSPSPMRAVTKSPGHKPSFSQAVSLDSLFDCEEDEATLRTAPDTTLPTLEPASAVTSADTAVARLSKVSFGDTASGEWLFSQLERISGEGKVAKEDYYDAASGWDISGLREDIQIHMDQCGSA